MAQNPNSLRLVTFTADARRDQHNIYDDTAERWGDEQAEAYALFLLDAMQLLADNPNIGRLVPEFSGLRRYMARWKNARHGHNIFFEQTETGILIIRVLGTRMDWPQHLRGA